ncbi:MAG: hypothetical protein R3F14_39955 [Polyangiaceae bacterium]
MMDAIAERHRSKGHPKRRRSFTRSEPLEPISAAGRMGFGTSDLVSSSKWSEIQNTTKDIEAIASTH